MQTLEMCKSNCFSNSDCHAIEWYPLRKFIKTKKQKGKPNCILKQNTLDQWITQSSGNIVTKKNGGLQNAVLCIAKNSGNPGGGLHS